jgi:hypothetical protein
MDTSTAQTENKNVATKNRPDNNIRIDNTFFLSPIFNTTQKNPNVLVLCEGGRCRSIIRY